MPLPEGEKNLTIYAFVSIQYWSVTGGRTDGQTCHHSIAFGMHRLAANARQKFGMKRKKFSLPSGRQFISLPGAETTPKVAQYAYGSKLFHGN